MIEVKDIIKDYKVAKRDKNFLRYLLKREYEMKRAVDGISFTISKGELVGYIGPNGAGKSSTIKMLTGILTPTYGHISVLGNSPTLKRKENASKIGVVFGQRTQLWWDLPVADSYELLRRIYKIPYDVYMKNHNELIDVMDIGSFINKPVRQLSLGQRVRADLVASLLHNPEILFLDEPTIGLDVVVKKQIRQFIRKMRNDREITVILTTHDMKDIEEICDRIMMIDHGKVMLDMQVNEVKNRLGGLNTVVVDFELEPEHIEIPNVTLVSKEGPRWTFAYRRESISNNELLTKISNLSSVIDVSFKEPDIEDIIRDIYTGNIIL